MGGRRDAANVPHTVTRSEFRREARAVIARAEREGPIVVTDERGTARMVIHCPRDKRPHSDD
jgi:hypothetical protein